MGSASHMQDGGKKAIHQNIQEGTQGNADMRKEGWQAAPFSGWLQKHSTAPTFVWFIQIVLPISSYLQIKRNNIIHASDVHGYPTDVVR